MLYVVNKQMIIDDTSSAKDLPERFVMRETDKCTREKREAKMEPCDLKRKERKTDIWLSAKLNAERRINRQKVANEKRNKLALGTSI